MAPRRRASDKPMSIQNICKTVVIVSAAIGAIWAAQLPYIDNRIECKLEPLRNNLEYLKCLIEQDKTDAEIKSAKLRAGTK